MPMLSLAEAAKHCGVNRSTILRAVKSGKVSGTRNEDGSWSVEASELFLNLLTTFSSFCQGDKFSRQWRHHLAPHKQYLRRPFPIRLRGFAKGFCFFRRYSVAAAVVRASPI
jgi:hypothetical protein